MDNKKSYVKTNELTHSVVEIEFYHPSHNSLPSDLLLKLSQEITACSDNHACKIILLKSGGDRTFCAGANFDELMALKKLDEATAFFMGFANVINAIKKSSKIVIGRIQGKAVGGGVGLAAACDYCLASKYASVKLSELAIGIGPFVIEPAVSRKIGIAAFSKLAINATEWQTAKWGKEFGMFQEVFETTQQLDEYLLHFTKTLSTMSASALTQLKSILWEKSGDWDQLLKDRAKISGSLILSKEARAALAKIKA